VTACKNRGFNNDAGSLSNSSSILGDVLDVAGAVEVIECKRDDKQSFVLAFYDGEVRGKVGYKNGDAPAKIIVGGTADKTRDGGYSFAFAKDNANGNKEIFSGDIGLNLKLKFFVNRSQKSDIPDEPCKRTEAGGSQVKPKETPIF
jgi:hypothetical protein